MVENTEITVIQENGAVAPVSVDELIRVVDSFQDFKTRVLREADFWVDPKDKEKKKRVRKSGWLKYAMACNLSIERAEETRESLTIPDIGEVIVYNFMYRATAPNGRYATGTGTCSTNEKRGSYKLLHDTRTQAETRAINRSISMLVGGGEVSAEEIQTNTPTKPRQIVPSETKVINTVAPELGDPETILAYVEAKGLNTEILEIDAEEDVTIIRLTKFIDNWREYDNLLGPLGFRWMPGGKRWEANL